MTDFKRSSDIYKNLNIGKWKKGDKIQITTDVYVESTKDYYLNTHIPIGTEIGKGVILNYDGENWYREFSAQSFGRGKIITMESYKNNKCIEFILRNKLYKRL